MARSLPGHGKRTWGTVLELGSFVCLCLGGFPGGTHRCHPRGWSCCLELPCGRTFRVLLCPLPHAVCRLRSADGAAALAATTVQLRLRTLCPAVLLPRVCEWACVGVHVPCVHERDRPHCVSVRECERPHSGPLRHSSSSPRFTCGSSGSREALPLDPGDRAAQCLSRLGPESRWILARVQEAGKSHFLFRRACRPWSGFSPGPAQDAKILRLSERGLNMDVGVFGKAAHHSHRWKFLRRNYCGDRVTPSPVLPPKCIRTAPKLGCLPPVQLSVLTVQSPHWGTRT